MKESNVALRLQPSLMDEARKVARAEGVHADRGNVMEALRIRRRAGVGKPPSIPRASPSTIQSNVGRRRLEIENQPDAAGA
jgi:ketopantoate reductase